MSRQLRNGQEGGDRMRRILLNGWLLVLAAGCSQPPVKPDLNPAIKELDQAIASKAVVRQPDAVSQALLPPIVVEMPRADGKPVEPHFDLSVNNAAASEVFMAIVSGTRYSMIVHPSIKERVSVNLKDVTVREALDTMREMYGYEYKVQGNRILIEPVTLQTRVFRVNYLLGARKGRSEIRVSSGAVSDTVGQQQAGETTSGMAPQTSTRALESSRIVTTSDTDIWVDLVSSVRAIIGAEGGRNVIVNAQSGIVVVRALPAELRQVDEFLNAVQGVVARQVMLEAKIIEVQLKDQFATGINWAAFGEHIAAGVLSPGTILSPQGIISAFTARGEDGNLLPNSRLRSNTAPPGFIESETAVPGTVFGLALQTSSFAALLGFLRDPGRPAGAVEPAHRDAQQPEGRPQGRQRPVLRDQHHQQPDRRSRRYDAEFTLHHTPALLLGCRSGRYAADRRNRADHPAHPPFREPGGRTRPPTWIWAKRGLSGCRLPPATSAKPIRSCVWATATSWPSAA